MERLTARIKSGELSGTAICPTLYVQGTAMEDYDAGVIQAMIDRLADYEDRGLSPEQIEVMA
jgi:uncharacterized membrane protein